MCGICKVNLAAKATQCNERGNNFWHARAHLVSHVWSLRLAQQRYARVCLRGENVHQCIAMSVKSYRRGRFEQLSVERAQDSDVVVAASGGSNDATVAVNHLQELAYDQRHCLNSLDLLLSTQQLPLQASLFFFDVLLLQQAPNSAR